MKGPGVDQPLNDAEDNDRDCPEPGNCVRGVSGTQPLPREAFLYPPINPRCVGCLIHLFQLQLGCFADRPRLDVLPQDRPLCRVAYARRLKPQGLSTHLRRAGFGSVRC